MRAINTRFVTRGTTSVPSVLEVSFTPPLVAGVAFLRARVCNSAGFATATNATIAASGGDSAVETHTSGKDLTFRSSTPVKATGTLTVSGVAIDGETATIGARVYEFDASTASGITNGNVRVDISANATKAAGTLTLAVQPAAGETMTIGTRTYVYVASGAGDTAGEISIGADLAAAKLNTVAAINGTDGFNVANTKVTASAFSTNVCTITAIIGGTAGNAIVMTEALAGSGNVMNGSGVLGATTAGVDCTAANATVALAAAINGDGSAVATATSTSSTVLLTAIHYGTASNSFATTETMANGSFGAATLTGGSDSIANKFRIAVTNATAETVTLRFGPSLVGGFEADYVGTTADPAAVDVTHAA